jgi:hypothetical protein
MAFWLAAALMAGAASFSAAWLGCCCGGGDGGGQRIGAGGGCWVGASLGAHAGRFGLDASAGAALRRAGIGLHGNVGCSLAVLSAAAWPAGPAWRRWLPVLSAGQWWYRPARPCCCPAWLRCWPCCCRLRLFEGGLEAGGQVGAVAGTFLWQRGGIGTGASAAALAAPLATSATTALAAGSAASTSGALWALSTTAAVAALARRRHRRRGSAGRLVEGRYQCQHLGHRVGLCGCLRIAGGTGRAVAAVLAILAALGIGGLGGAAGRCGGRAAAFAAASFAGGAGIAVLAVLAVLPVWLALLPSLRLAAGRSAALGATLTTGLLFWR